MQHYASSHNLTELAELAQMSPFHLNRVFHYMMGLPLHQYAIRLRIAVAARAIREGQSVTEAAYSVGFNSVSFFSRSFRKHFGMSPRQYREQRTSEVSPRSWKSAVHRREKAEPRLLEQQYGCARLFTI
jgi:AraC family transcriptional regulator